LYFGKIKKNTFCRKHAFIYVKAGRKYVKQYGLKDWEATKEPYKMLAIFIAADKHH
jgi:hypothetical protein